MEKKVVTVVPLSLQLDEENDTSIGQKDLQMKVNPIIISDDISKDRYFHKKDKKLKHKKHQRKHKHDTHFRGHHHHHRNFCHSDSEYLRLRGRIPSHIRPPFRESPIGQNYFTGVESGLRHHYFQNPTFVQGTSADFELSLPFFTHDEIKVTIDDNVLLIKAKHTPTSDDDDRPLCEVNAMCDVTGRNIEGISSLLTHNGMLKV